MAVEGSSLGASKVIPVPVIMEGKVFPFGFGALSLLRCLRAEECSETDYAHHRPAFAPEIMDAMTLGAQPLLWDMLHSGSNLVTGSLVATGYSPLGTNLVVVAHVPHYLLNPDFLSLQLSRIFAGLPEFEPPKEEFHRLLRMQDDKNVFVLEKSPLYTWPSSGVFELENAIEHPLLVPFCGGRDRAEKHLARLENILQAHRSHTGDSEAKPGVAIHFPLSYAGISTHLLAFCGINCLDGNYRLRSDGFVVGVPQYAGLPLNMPVAEKAAAK